MRINCLETVSQQTMCHRGLQQQCLSGRVGFRRFDSYRECRHSSSNSDWRASESICHHPSIVFKESSLWRGTDSSLHVFSTVPTTTIQHQKEKKHSAGRIPFLFTPTSQNEKRSAQNHGVSTKYKNKSVLQGARAAAADFELQLAFKV